MSGTHMDAAVDTTETTLSGAELAERIDRLYRTHRDDVHRIALRYGRGNRSFAEDVTQDVFLTLCRTIGRVDSTRDMAPWFYRVTTNRCLSKLRRDAVRNAPGVRWIIGRSRPAPIDPEALTSDRRTISAAFEVLQTLPPKQQVAFCAYHLDGKQLDEIGDIMGHSKGYVCKLVKRAEEAIRAAGWEVGDG